MAAGTASAAAAAATSSNGDEEEEGSELAGSASSSSKSSASSISAAYKRAIVVADKLERYKNTINGWGMGRPDHVSITPDVDCWLVGVGVYGGSNKLTGEDWITEVLCV